ncbi:claudin-4-like [Megalops cyprinoides]|uniref:claudin-4-like n=1 Tax=Megalops cyprinoides TaxID=118141 RepID=UPI0018644F2C|nr:claudin-4-like [Megalops cyprinoides]
MPSMGMQMLASALAVLGWVGVIATCGLPMWRVTAFIGNNIVTSQTIWEGIWMSCVVQSTGQMQCKAYDSMLALSSDLQAARALTALAIMMGLVGLLMVFAGGKCTSFITGNAKKARITIAAGAVLIATGVLCLIPVSWTASSIVRNFYNPQMTDAQRREMGASLYLGWGASILLILGGGLLCSSCPHKEEEKSPSVKYLIVRSSRPTSQASSQRSAAPPASSPTPTKTYL